MKLSIKIKLFVAIVTMMVLPTRVFGQKEDNIRTYVMNYKVLNEIITEGQKDPDWVDGELTIFKENCEKYILKKSDNLEKVIIVMNTTKKDVTINGRSMNYIIKHFYFMPTGFEMSEKSKVFRQLYFALDEAQDRGIYNQVFTEIRDK